MSVDSISEGTIPLAAEDRFLIFGIRDAAEMCPSGKDADYLGETILGLPGRYVPVFDLRGLSYLYTDVEAFVAALADALSRNARPHFLVNPSCQELVEQLTRCFHNSNFLDVKGNPYRTKPLVLADFYHGQPSRFFPKGIRDTVPAVDLAASWLAQTLYAESRAWNDALEAPPPNSSDVLEAFTDDVLRRTLNLVKFKGISHKSLKRSFQKLLPDLAPRMDELGVDEAYRTPESIEYFIRAAMLESFVAKMHAHSLLVQFAMTAHGETIECIPYHGGAIHHIETPGSKELLDKCQRPRATFFVAT